MTEPSDTPLTFEQWWSHCIRHGHELDCSAELIAWRERVDVHRDLAAARAELFEAQKALLTEGMDRDRLAAEVEGLKRDAGRMREALQAALPRLSHKAACGTVNPTEHWAEKGSWNFDNCNCEIAVVRAAIAKTARRIQGADISLEPDRS